MLSNHLILCQPLLLLLSIFPSIRVVPMSWLLLEFISIWLQCGKSRWGHEILLGQGSPTHSWRWPTVFHKLTPVAPTRLGSAVLEGCGSQPGQSFGELHRGSSTVRRMEWRDFKSMCFMKVGDWLDWGGKENSSVSGLLLEQESLTGALKISSKKSLNHTANLSSETWTLTSAPCFESCRFIF